MNTQLLIGLCASTLLASCVAPPPPPPKPMWCPPKKVVATAEPQKNPRLREVNGRTIEDVPPEEVEPVKSVLDVKR